MPADALFQSHRALRKVQQSSQDNLAAVGVNIAPPANMYVAALITPLGTQCSEGAIVKTKPMVLKSKTQSMDSGGSAMEVDQPTARARPPVQKTQAS